MESKNLKENPMKLHLGCGQNQLNGWVNIDMMAGPTVDRVQDLRQGLPYGDKTVDAIFCEHTLEHFTLKEGKELLKECYRVLRVGGRIRIGVPSLERAIGHYNKNTWRQEGWIKRKKIKSRAEFMNAYFREWGHKFIYDEESLIGVLQSCGFKESQRQRHRTSSCPDLCHLEFRTAQETDLIVEGVK